MSHNGEQKTVAELDAELSTRYGDYAGFETDASPYLVEYYGEEPLTEVKRLLAQMACADSKILDVGCGPGHTLSKFAPKVAEAWGLDEDDALLEAARARITASGLSNVTLCRGSVANAADVESLPDNYFDIAFTESGPNLTPEVAAKLTDNAIFLQEIGGHFGAYQFHEIMGRKPYTYYAYGHDYSDQVLLSHMAALDFVPISFKNYFFDWYFRDIDHLEAHVINVPWELGDWRMGGPLPYDRERDRAALKLYASYNTTAKGIRFQEHIRVFAWRRERVHFYPVTGLPR